MEWRIRQASGMEDQADQWNGGSDRLVKWRIRQTSGMEDQTD